MGNVLLASGSLEGKEILSQLIKDTACITVTTNSGNEARRLINSSEFEMILINTPLKDEFGHEFAIKAAETTNAGVILMCKSDISDDLTDKLSCSGIFIIPKPVNKVVLKNTINLAFATRSRMLGFSNNSSLQSKTEEIKLINRAKSCLMQYLKLTEPQAHRYIEKQAMDTRRTRKEVAKHILSTYEN